MAVSSAVYARNMERRDINKVYSLCRKNYIFSATRLMISHFHQHTPLSIVVLVSEADIVLGFCYIYITCGKFCTSGFAVKPPENSLLIQQALFEEGCRRINDNQVETIAPAAMRGYFRDQRYILRKDIHLYSADLSNLVLPTASTDRYIIFELERSYGFPLPFFFTSADGNEKAICLDERILEKPEVSFTLSHQNGKITGFGALHKNFEREWLIAPLYASEENEIKIILNELISYIRRKEESATVRMYLLRSSLERCSWLEESRFEKCPQEWSRYSPPGSDDRKVDEITYSDAERFIFAVASIMSSEF